MDHAGITPWRSIPEEAETEQTGVPLTTSESWASWYDTGGPDLDWGWLLNWAEWPVEDAIE